MACCDPREMEKDTCTPSGEGEHSDVGSGAPSSRDHGHNGDVYRQRLATCAVVCSL